MPGAVAFDTLTCAKRLKAAGFTEEQADVQAEVFLELVDERLATKQDILGLKRDMKELETSLKRDIKELDASSKRDNKELETSLKRDMKELEMRLTIRLGGMMAASIVIVAALVKLL